MIKLMIELLRTTELTSENIRIAKGKNLFPSNWTELKNYIKQN